MLAAKIFIHYIYKKIILNHIFFAERGFTMKKTISFILCLSLAAATVMPAYAIEQDTAETNSPATNAPETDSTKITKGDIVADDIVDVTDLTELSLALIGDKELSDEQMKAADVDDTGEVNLADLAKIRQFLSKKIPSLEVTPETDPEQNQNDKPNENPPAESVTPSYYYDLYFNDYENLSDNLLASMYEKEDESKAIGAYSEGFEKYLESVQEKSSVWVPLIDGEEPEWRDKEGFYNISLVEDLFGKPCLFFHFADEESNSYIKVTDVSEEFKKFGTKSTTAFLKAMDKTPEDGFFSYDQSETKIIDLPDGTSVEAIFGKITKTETSWDGSTVSDTRTYVHFLYNGSFVSVCCRPETLEAGLLEKFSLKSIPINHYRFDSTPVFLIRNKEKVNTQYGEREYYFNHVFTADGNSYNGSVPQYKPEAMPTYEEEISTFMNLGKRDRKLTLKNKTLLKKATELAKNAALYKECEMIKVEPKPYDECETHLELIYRDENGELKPLTVYYNNGGSGSWIDNAEIQEFIILMIEQGYLEGTNFLKAVTTVPDITPVETDHPDPPLGFEVKSISEYNGLKQAMEQSDEELKQYIASMEGHFSLNDRESAEKFTEQIDKLSFPKIISGKVSAINLTTGKSSSGESYEHWYTTVKSENGEWVRYTYYPDTAPDSFDYNKIGEAKNATVAIWGTPLQNNDGSIKIYADYMIPHSSGTGYLITMYAAINGETFTVSYYTQDPDKEYLTILKSASLVNIDGLDE